MELWLRRISPIWLALTLAISPLARAEELSDSVEESRTVAVGGIDSIDFPFTPKTPAIGNPSLVKVEQGSTERQVRVVPQKKGTTTIQFDGPDGKVFKKINYSFIPNSLSDKVNVIRKLLQDVEGITIESVDDKIVIDGELIVPKDFDRILQVQEAYKDVVFNLVSLSKISRDAIARRMQKEINDDPGGVNVQVAIKNDTFFLTGKVDNAGDKDRADWIAQTFMPEYQGSLSINNQVLKDTVKRFSIRNMIVVEEAPPAPPKKMVRITYHFVEIGKEFLKASFFKWVPFLQEGAGLTIGQSTTGGTAATGGGSFVGTITNLIPRLQSGASGGFARILFSTVGLGEDGTTIDMVRQEQIPFVEAVVNGVPVPGNASVGVKVKVTPTISGDQRLNLNTDLSFEVPTGNGAGGKPRTVRTAITNTVGLKSGDSCALGGLIQSSTSKDIDKDPETSSGAAGSALFTLLRSKSFRNSKTQFVVFVTPKIVDDAAEGTADIKAKILNNSQKKRRRIVN